MALVDQALAQGALGYLVKPLDVRQVLPTVLMALQRVVEMAALRAQTEQLSSALKQGRDISTAIGILMSRLTLSPAEALERLRQCARNERTRMEDIAKQVIADSERSRVLFARLFGGVRGRPATEGHALDG